MYAARAPAPTQMRVSVTRADCRHALSKLLLMDLGVGCAMFLQEFLMAGCWLLLKNPTNRQVLGNAFSANPASTKLAQGMMQKLQDTVDVADVNEAVGSFSC